MRDDTRIRWTAPDDTHRLVTYASMDKATLYLFEKHVDAFGDPYWVESAGGPGAREINELLTQLDDEDDELGEEITDQVRDPSFWGRALWESYQGPRAAWDELSGNARRNQMMAAHAIRVHVLTAYRNELRAWLEDKHRAAYASSHSSGRYAADAYAVVLGHLDDEEAP